MGKVDGAESVWAADPPAVWLDETIGRLVARRTATAPDAPAIHWLADDDVLTWTYGELHSRSASVATALRTSVEPGARVAVCAPNSLEWVVAFYAAAQVGVTVVPVNPAM